MCVYFVQAIDHPHQIVKIGTSSDLELRYSGLRQESEYTLKLLGFMPGTRKEESQIHKAFEVYQPPLQ